MKKFAFRFALFLLAGYSVAPFAWMALTSVKPKGELFRIPPTYLPNDFSVQSYGDLFSERQFTRYVLNSAVVAGSATLLCLFCGSLAAYALSRRRLRGAGVIQTAFLALALFPTIVFVVPLFKIVAQLGLLNNYFSLILSYAALNLPLTIWMLASFFDYVPTELEDAARVDGFSRLGFLLRVLLPLSAPALATAGILTFIFCWNEFLLAYTFMSDEAMWTVPVGIATLSGVAPEEVPWGEISAAVVVTTLPLVLVVLFLQRRIVEGLTAGAVKG